MNEYQILQQIGEGSFGRVYRARRKFTGRLVAIKMIKKIGQTKEDLTSFRREIDILSKADHPHVMRMLEIFETETDFCVVSELGRGDLFQIIDDNQTLPEKAIRKISAQLISALSYLHSQRIIHRDIKPQNVLITSNGSIKLCDFGFARALSYTTVALTSIKGTPLYMAPELVQEQPYDEKVDIWSLGVILYELYFGKPPFVSNSIYKLIQMIVKDQILWPNKISEDMKSFLMLMLQKDPNRRANCDTLSKHPFISSVKLEKYDDSIYRFKKEQFDDAIKQSMNTPMGSNTPDPQIVLSNPKSYTTEDLLRSINIIIETKIMKGSIIDIFVNEFSSLISIQTVLDNTLRTAGYLMKEKVVEPKSFETGCSLLTNDFTISSISFFIQLLSIPFSNSVLNAKPYSFTYKLTKDQAIKLRDHMLGFLFTPDVIDIAELYSLFSFLSQHSSTFLEVISDSFAPQFMPIISNVIINHPSSVVRTSGLSILARIITKNPETIQFILPKPMFLQALTGFFQKSINNFEDFCLFSAAISFHAISLPLFKDDYRVDLNTLFCEDKIKSLFKYSTYDPLNEAEILSLMSIIASPFIHLPQIDDSFSSILKDVKPLHQMPVIEKLVKMPCEDLYSIIPHIIDFIPNPLFTDIICKGILESMASPNINLNLLVTELCKNDIIDKLISLIQPSVSSYVPMLLAQIVLSFAKSTPLLLQKCDQMLKSLYSVKSVLEYSLIISSHLARLSSEFIMPLFSNGVLRLTEKSLRSPEETIRIRSSNLLGNICRHAAIPSENGVRLIPLLLTQMRSNSVKSQRPSAYALGNALFQSSDQSKIVADHISIVTNLLNSPDTKTIENSACVLGNLVRKSDDLVPFLIGKGVLDQLLGTFDKGEEVGSKIILPLSVFCKYEVARAYLSKHGAIAKIKPFANSSKPRVQRISQQMLACLS